MRTWQDIFAAKIKEKHIRDPWTLLEDDDLQARACGPGWKEFVQRRALGRFQCSQCFHKWSSAKVHILFHMSLCQGWGTVRMRIFRQECRRCPKPRLEDPELSLETTETILHNLVIKILQYFYKEPVQSSDLLEVVVDTPVMGPHNSAHCEACRLGICNRSQPAPAPDTWKPLTDKDMAGMLSTKSWLAWASGVWKPLSDVSKARTYSTESESSLEPTPQSDDHERWIGVGKARTYSTESESSLEPTPRSDDHERLISVGKARTHRTERQPALARVARNANVTRTFQTLKRQGLSPHAASTHLPSPSTHRPSRCNSNFSWKRCCCIGSSLLCVLAVIIFVVLYLTLREGPGDRKEDHREESGQWPGTVMEGLGNWALPTINPCPWLSAALPGPGGMRTCWDALARHFVPQPQED